MPKKLEKKLKKEARARGMTKNGELSRRGKAYVYGTMQKKTEWKPRNRSK